MLIVFKNNRSGRYYAQYKVNGVKHQFSCKTPNRKQAQKYASQRYEEILGGKQAKTNRGLSLAKFRDEFLSTMASRYSGKTLKVIKDSFSQLLKRIGDKNLRELTVEDLERFIYTEQPSSHTALKHYRTLRAVFNKAVTWKLLDNNPFLQFEKPMLVEKTADYFTEEEFIRFINSIPQDTYCNTRLRNVTILAFETGLRLGELRNLQVTAINFESKYVDIRNSSTWRTKNGRNRRVPLTNRAYDALYLQIQINRIHNEEGIRNSLYIFPNPQGLPLNESHLSRLFKRQCCQIFPERNLHFHSLRHSMAHRAFLLNVPVLETQQILGHSTVILTEKYGASQRLTFPNYLKACNKDRS